MPIKDLIAAFDPPPPSHVIEAARKLRYRDFITVGVIVKKPDVFSDNWIYIHSPEVKVGRIQNFKNWSPEMVANPAYTSLGLEYFVQEGDELWSTDDAQLIELAVNECAELGLIDREDFVDGVVIRMPKAYPVYDQSYKSNLSVVRDYLGSIENLQLIGRNGQHRYNNQDHSMLTGSMPHVTYVAPITMFGRSMLRMTIMKRGHAKADAASSSFPRFWYQTL
jgi:protoporphyrinogen oxidase